MHLQGNLQTVFDALFRMGVIDPVLKKDWSELLEQGQGCRRQVEHAVHTANFYQGNVQNLITELKKFDSQTLEFLAMEVAREYAGFHTRTDLQ